jgi:hypothetical protein
MTPGRRCPGMRNRQRRVFAAPFIFTIAAACTGGAPKTVEKPEPDPDPVAEPYQTWTVSSSGEGRCEAYVEVDCPPDASCNPPPPMAVACPAGLADGEQITVVQLEENGPCTAGDQETECPSWETEQAE